MVNNVNGNNDNVGKIWTKIRKATTDDEYLKGLDAKVNSIMKGKKTVDIEQLKNNSVYSNMDTETLARFNKIAKLDGDAKSFSKDEIRLLYALSDAKLVNNQFEFDLKWENTDLSALKEATSKDKFGELELFVENLTEDDSTARHIKTVDTSKFDKSKPLADKLKSDNPDEVMSAINDEIMTDYVNPKTGKKMPVTEVVSLVSKFVKENSHMDYDDICKNINEKYGIPISDYEKGRGLDGSYKIGDWEIRSSGGIISAPRSITNKKTGQCILGQDTNWNKKTIDTIPNTDGYLFMINTYSDKDGNTIEFNTQNEVDTIQPSGAAVYGPDGAKQNVKYDIEETIDPSIYGFIPYND